MSFEDGGRGKLVPAMIILFGLFFGALYFTYTELKKNRWPQMEAKRTNVVGQTVMKINAAGRTDEQSAIISFAYSVDGKDYQSKESVDTTDERGIARFQRLTAGPMVPIRYDPARPGDAFIDDGERERWWWIKWVFVLASAAVLAIAILKWRATPGWPPPRRT